MAIFWQDFETMPNSMITSQFLQDGRKTTRTLSEFPANNTEFSSNYADFAIAGAEISVNVGYMQRCQVLRFVRNYYACAANITVLRAAVKNYGFLILSFSFIFF